MKLNRRNFIKTSAVATLGAGVRAQRVGAAAAGSGRPRNVIFLVSDGMSSGTLSMADQYLRWRDHRPSHWMKLYEDGRVHRGLMETASRNSIVTDSAAASSAWGCGHRVNNGALNMGPNGEKYEPICVSARKAGKSTGLVTTAQVTHATPAGFAANVPRRHDQQTIAVQYLERKVDVLLGGGLDHFRADRRNDEQDLLEMYGAEGYAVARNTAEMKDALAGSDRLLGLFSSSGHLPYEIDRVNSESARSEVPSLAEMMRASLEILNRNPEGFLVQVEGARVDHAAHANDASGLIFDQIAFDDAIPVAVEFAEQVPDTLVVVTTDHGNANPGLNSGGNGGERYFSALSGFSASVGTVLRELNADQRPEEIIQRIADKTTIELSRDQAELMRNQLRQNVAMPYHRMGSSRAVLGQLLANHLEIGWIGNSHTSDHVELAAFGPGSERVQAFVKNTEMNALMRAGL